MPDGPAAGDLVDDPRVRAALAIGNPAVMEALSRSGRVAEGSRLARTLQRYLVRMSTRPTPYGLFAGTALVAWADTTDVELGTARPRTRTRPDMGWLLGLVFDVESDPAVRRHLAYVANPELTERAGRLFAPVNAMGGPRSTVSVRATDIVRGAIALARNPIRHDDLIAELVALAHAPIARIEVLVEQLWQQQLLLTDLRPPLTNHDPAGYVEDRLSGIPQAAAAHCVLSALRAALADFDTCPLTAAEAAYGRLLEMSDYAGAAAPPQVDMALPLVGAQVHRAVADDAARAAELLLRLTPEHHRGALTAAYRARFEERYGVGRAVPLLEVLDPNSGLGSPYAAAETPTRRGFTARDHLLMELAGNALCDGRTSIELDESTLEQLSTPFSATQAPLSLDVPALVVAESPADVDDGNYHLVIGPSLGAVAAGRMLGRFADLLGEAARTALKEVHSRESELSSEVIFAELSYLPMTAKNANVAIRQHSRHHEFVIGVSPGVEPAQVIPLDEVAVESTGERFRLWWSARGAEVAVVAGHMLNARTGPDVCGFLTDVSIDSRVPFVAFDWGAATMLPALPRIHVGRIVLCPARYRPAPLVRAAGAAESMPAFARAVAEWRTRLRVPRYVNVGSYDYRLLVDLESTAELDGLRHQLRRHAEPNRLMVEEALPSPAHAWLPGPGGRYVSEVVVPLFRISTDASETNAPTFPQSTNSSHRIRPPGSDWLYFKLYCPPAFEDDVIVEAGREACRAVGAGLADRWFFVRYCDPEPHVRLRLHGRPEDLTSTLFRRLCAWATQLVDRGLCSSFTVGTYERELERYRGPEGMAFAEAIFHADSNAVVDILALRRTGRLVIDDVVLAALTCYDLLDTLDEDEHHLAWYGKTIPRHPPPDPARASRVRDLRALITLGPTGYRGGEELSTILAGRRVKLSRPSMQLDPALLGDHLHMHHNRLLGSRGSERETLITLGKVLHGLSVAPHRR
jgi:thiopeptide-type bacteriocin biosynthesis protein